MKRRDFIQSAAFGTVALAASAAARKPRRPNLVFIFSDQQSWDTLGCYGNTQTHTPNLDRLAAQGIRFDSCFSTYPLCGPMRAMLLSGQHPLRNGVCKNDWQMLPDNGPTFASVLRDSGYRTGYIGKWHLYGGNRNRPIPPGPHRQGFDDVFLSNNCSLHYQPEHAFFWDGEKKVKFGMWEQFGQAGQAVDFIERCNPDEPFALFVSWHPPHDHSGAPEWFGYEAPAKFRARYNPEKIRLRPDQPDDERHRKLTCGHYALVDTIDDCFGRIEDALRKQGLSDDTIVVFTSDHGDLLRFVSGKSQHKGRPEPASCQAPLLIRYPAHLEPRVSNLIVGTLDLMPTLLGLMQLPVPDTCEGKDLSQAVLMRNDSASMETPLLSLGGDWAGEYGWRGVATRTHIYSTQFGTVNPPPDSEGLKLLIDRNKDPYAMRNLHDTPAAADLQKDLHERTVKWMKHYGDECWAYLDMEKVSATMLDGFRKNSGELKGRPIDLLHEAGIAGLLTHVSF